MTWITPAEVDDVEFTTRRLRRGYDEAEVDLFLDRVALDVHEMQAEIARLRVELERAQDVPRTVVDGYLVSDGRGDTPTSPGHTIYPELAPEALAASVPLPSADEGLERDVPELGRDSSPDRGDSLQEGRNSPAATGTGLGHPSSYGGALTPAQRRRDKHKQRGQYAPAPGWTTDTAELMSPHWKPEGDRWVAEWRIEWQDDVAAVDEEIAAWVERQRAWLAADRWDRGARRLGAVA